jgi:hypothetical protein
MFKSKRAAFTVALIALTIMITGCKTQPDHANQINTFDGTTYDSLTVAHAALASFRPQLSTTDTQYVSIFNEAAASYSTAFNSYLLYRANQSNQTAVSVNIINLTVSIVSLENAIQTALRVSPETVLRVREKADRMRIAANPRITISDILTELEIAAAIVQTLRGTQPYSGLAAIVINATQQALAALDSASGQAIDLSTIQPLALIY